MRIVTDSLTDIYVTQDLPLSTSKTEENPTEIVSVVTVQTLTASVVISTLRNGQTTVVTAPGNMISSVGESVRKGDAVSVTTTYTWRD